MNEFTAEFFIGNRARLCQALPGHLVVIAANSTLQRNADVTYRFRQDSNFWYLSGLDMPDIILLIDTNSGESTVLMEEPSDYALQWDGAVSPAEVMRISGADKVMGVGKLIEMINDASGAGKKIGYLKPIGTKVEPYGFYSNPARRVAADLIKSVEPNPVDVRQHIARLRQIKQPIELEYLQEAIDITGDSLAAVKAKLGDMKTEADVEYMLTSEFYARRGDGHGFDPIIASGVNAATLHYTSNSSQIVPSEMLLLDVGTQKGYYSADISRTWIVGKPTQRQIDVHSAVLSLQQKAYDMLKPGVLIKDYQKKMEKLAAKELKKLGIKPGPYPHGISHFLGLDVHDAGDYSQPLVSGSVLTVEPGIYLPEENIGVRLEDNILITDDGIKNLSRSIPSDL